jgi:lysozyme family protein
MSQFAAAIGGLLKNEGSALVSNDHGRGASKYGITLATYRELHPAATDDDIARLGPEQATAFYRTAFWERYHLGLLEDQEVANKVLDLGVNMGGGTAVRLLQRAIGVSPADGVLGPKTAAAVNKRQPAIVMQGLRTAGAQYYQELVQRRPDYKPCLPGWLARLAK